MKQHKNVIGPVQFEVMNALLVARELWSPQKTSKTKVWISGYRSHRDLIVRLEVDGPIDPFIQVFASARIFARTRARHERHLRMMHQLLGEVGYQCHLTMPNYTTNQRAKSATKRIGE